MNMKLKSLVAIAIAGMAISGAANATLADTQTGNSSLILTLVDQADGVSAAFDLGFTLSSFDQTTSNTWNLTSANYGTAFSDFFATANAATTSYAVMAGNSVPNYGTVRLFTTVANNWTTTSGTTLQNMQRAFDGYIDANNVIQTYQTGLSADSVTSASGGAAYAGTGAAYGTSGKIDTFGGGATVALGTNAYVWNIVKNGTNGLTAATATKVSLTDGSNPYFSLGTNGTLSYVAAAPVPEADTWALMAAGLGLMGFIARRRTKGEFA